ncbi:hypothetical protein GCM10010267_61190 [Streptomyces griseorubens]|nr:hypothetical protein GCM10010267_61190 [Streptomyces griseorubens]
MIRTLRHLRGRLPTTEAAPRGAHCHKGACTHVHGDYIRGVAGHTPDPGTDHPGTRGTNRG